LICSSSWAAKWISLASILRVFFTVCVEFPPTPSMASPVTFTLRFFATFSDQSPPTSTLWSPPTVSVFLPPTVSDFEPPTVSSSAAPTV
jgi:hypothetical protein